VITLLIGIAMVLIGVMMFPICFALTGDEMPGWLEEWAPLAAFVIALSGGILIVVSSVLIVTEWL
jgi:hypothetical protein